MFKRNAQKGVPGEPGQRRKGIFFYRKVCWKTTWLFRSILVLAFLLVLLLAKGPVSRAIGESLVAHVESEHCDALLIENFNPNYLLFEKSRKLLESGMAAGVFVPVPYNRGKSGPNRVSEEIVAVMAEVSRIGEVQTIAIPEVEPIRYNAALVIGRSLKNREINSVMLVTSGFRSSRSSEVMSHVLGPMGIKVYCLPVFGERNPTNWTESWHGIQEVVLEFGKLWYYRLFVL